MDLTFFEMTARQKTISNFGRRMMQFSQETSPKDVPLEILNAMSRIGEELAETCEVKNLSKTDVQVIKYAKKVLMK